eukprot:g17667.t1
MLAEAKDGRIFIVGGRNAEENFGDVWSGNIEGGDWQRLVEVAFGPRHGHALLVSRGQSPQISFRLLRILPPAILREVEVKPEFVEEFLKVMTALAAGARAEAGCLRYDLLRAQESSCKFLAYEVFISKKAFESHAAAPYAKALEAFEKDSRSPIVSTSLSEVEVMDFQRSSPAPADQWQHAVL